MISSLAALQMRNSIKANFYLKNSDTETGKQDNQKNYYFKSGSFTLEIWRVSTNASQLSATSSQSKYAFKRQWDDRHFIDYNAVLGIRIWRIHMFLGLQDPDPSFFS